MLYTIVESKKINQQQDLIFKTYYKKIVSKYYKATRNQMLSEDLAIEVIEKVFRSMKKQYNPQQSLGAWVSTITSNHLIDYYRKNAAKKNQVEKNTGYGEYPATCYNQVEDSQIDTDSIMEDIKNEIRKLSAEDQIIVKNVAFYNISYEEVGEQLNLSVRTVKNRMNKIKSQIKHNIKVLS